MFHFQIEDASMIQFAEVKGKQSHICFLLTYNLGAVQCFRNCVDAKIRVSNVFL